MSIKLERASKIANLLPMAEREILGSIPDALAQRLTGKDLALVMAALNTHWHKARAYEARELLAEGHIWDGAAKAHRRLGPPLSSEEFVRG